MSNDRRGAEHPVFKNAGGMGVDEARLRAARPKNKIFASNEFKKYEVKKDKYNRIPQTIFRLRKLMIFLL